MINIEKIINQNETMKALKAPLKRSKTKLKSDAKKSEAPQRKLSARSDVGEL